MVENLVFWRGFSSRDELILFRLQSTSTGLLHSYLSAQFGAKFPDDLKGHPIENSNFAGGWRICARQGSSVVRLSDEF
jgi:hypothetical protein